MAEDIIGYTPKPCADANYGKIPQLRNDEQHLNAAENSHLLRENGDLSTTPTNAKMETVADFVPCERTLRMVIEKVSAINSYAVSSAARCAIETLLPKPDRTEELIDGWFDKSPKIWSNEHIAAVKDFIRHGIAQGEIRG